MNAPRSPGAPGSDTGRQESRRERWLARLEAGGQYRRWVLWAALAGMFTSTFPITILTVALGDIAEEFGTSESTIAWVLTAPMLLSAVALPLLGKLGDLRGHRRVFLAGYAAATVTAALTALAWDAGSLIGLRTLSAVLGGATQPTSMALILSVYPRNRRVRAMGWWSMTAAGAPALGLIAGGPLVEWLGWRIVFVIQAVLSAITLALAAAVLRETPRQRVRFDVAGALALGVGIGGFMFALGRVREVGLLSPTIAWSSALCLAGLAAFVGVERRAVAPLLPLELLRRRAFVAPLLSNGFMGSAYMGAFVLAPIVLIKLLGFSIAAASGIMLLRTVSLTVASPVGAWLGGRIGERGAALAGAGLMTLALAVIVQAVGEASLVGFGVGLVLQGAGHGLGLPSLTSSIANAVSDSDLGIASAANRLSGQVGSAFGITVLMGVYAGLGTGPGLERAFAVGTALSFLSFLAAAGMRSTSHGATEAVSLESGDATARGVAEPTRR